MRRLWVVVVVFAVTFILVIGGAVLTRINESWGFALMLTGIFIIWTWSLWRDVINWFRKRK